MGSGNGVDVGGTRAGACCTVPEIPRVGVRHDPAARCAFERYTLALGRRSGCEADARRQPRRRRRSGRQAYSIPVHVQFLELISFCPYLYPGQLALSGGGQSPRCQIALTLLRDIGCESIALPDDEIRQGNLVPAKGIPWVIRGS